MYTRLLWGDCSRAAWRSENTLPLSKKSQTKRS